jgi:hypothetical protein
VVEAEHARILQDLERFGRQRAGAKARGHRQLSRAERETLAALRRVSLDGPANPADPT